jgi:RNA polymerase sigma-70 factor (ECF subfamily)
LAPTPTPERDRERGPDAAAAGQDVARDVAAAQRGDVAAFARLYHAHAGRVMALCLRLAGDRPAAEELMQDAFVRAWERLPAFRGESAFSTWMHRVTVNTFLQANRSTRRRAAHEEVSEDIEALPALTVSSDPGDRIDLERAIASLPRGARTAFVLHDIEGFKHEEIAALSGIAAATVRAQLHRARRLLMEALDR